MTWRYALWTATFWAAMLATGPLASQQTVVQLDAALTVGDVRDIHVSPDGLDVYVNVGEYRVEETRVFRRSTRTGALALSSRMTGDRVLGNHLAFSSDGRRVYSMRQRSPNSRQFFDLWSRDPDTGVLRFESSEEIPQQFEDSPDNLGDIRGMYVSPDNRFLYIAIFTIAPGDSAVGYLSTFEIDPETQNVDFTRFVDLPSRAWQVAEVLPIEAGDYLISVENDGGPTHLTTNPAFLRIYARDRQHGSLEEVSRIVLREGESTSTAVVSPDERFIFVSVFSKFPSHPIDREGLFVVRVDSRGSVPQLELVHQILEEEMPFLDIPRQVEVDSSGRWLSVLTRNGLAIFEVDPASGQLTLAQTIDADQFGEASLERAHLAASPASGHLYFADGATSELSTLTLGCSDRDDSLCLRAGDRFQVEVDWETPDGRRGGGRLVQDGASDRSGLFYFFRPDNWEMLVKVIDGCGENDRFWAFAAATTNLGYTLRITDTWSGTMKTYENPLDSAAPAITDTQALATCAAQPPTTFGSRRAYVVPPEAAVMPEAGSVSPRLHGVGTRRANACSDSDDALCLLDGRFRAEVRWRDFVDRRGVGTRVDIDSDDAGLFTFFNSNNWEMLVKVLDGCSTNGHFWVFGAATTNVEYELTITDIFTGEVRTYENPIGTASPSIVDTRAFTTCP